MHRQAVDRGGSALQPPPRAGRARRADARRLPRDLGQGVPEGDDAAAVERRSCAGAIPMMNGHVVLDHQEGDAEPASPAASRPVLLLALRSSRRPASSSSMSLGPVASARAISTRRRWPCGQRVGAPPAPPGDSRRSRQCIASPRRVRARVRPRCRPGGEPPTARGNGPRPPLHVIERGSWPGADPRLAAHDHRQPWRVHAARRRQALGAMTALDNVAVARTVPRRGGRARRLGGTGGRTRGSNARGEHALPGASRRRRGWRLRRADALPHGQRRRSRSHARWRPAPGSCCWTSRPPA